MSKHRYLFEPMRPALIPSTAISHFVGIPGMRNTHNVARPVDAGGVGAGGAAGAVAVGSQTRSALQ
jgi:hypothetical protein